jgi:hypothetical protein
MAVQKKRKTAAERAKEALPNIHAVEIPIGAVVDALKRLGQVCDYVEAQANQKDAERPWPSAAPPYNPDAGAYPAAQANPPQVGAEQQAKSIAEASFRLAAVAAELRDRFLYGGARPTETRPNGGVKETEGPLKDALNATGFHLDCMFGALEDINRYIGS